MDTRPPHTECGRGPEKGPQLQRKTSSNTKYRGAVADRVQPYRDLFVHAKRVTRELSCRKA